ncbi:hypothetical protein COB55_03480 [Candidatus Wolfebacteria bacterium]|nr:MAG: hypothetical protein COB55_03480 [Candidatus Wolfebacteria bacterium]
MFLSSKHSFLLRRRPVIKPSFPVFLPNTQSFLLVKGSIPQSSFPVFSPNAQSFLLVKGSIAKSSFPVFLPSSQSFLLTGKSVIDPGPLPDAETNEENAVSNISQRADGKQIKVSDQGKRNFLKAASIAGVGVIASQLSPKKAQALIMGSSPTTGVVGVKNANNERINPATEETAASQLKTSDLTFDSGALEVKIAGVSGAGSSSFADAGDVAKSALVDANRHVQVDVLSSALPTAATTETTLQTISFGGFKFALRMETVADIDYIGEAAISSATSSAVWRVKRLDNATGLVVLWAGTGAFDQIWDNRASLSYS